MARVGPRSIIAGLILVIAVAAFAAWYWVAVLSVPLRGDTSHDFGTVEIRGDDVVLTHTFSLVNHHGAPKTVKAVRPSCGCAAATVDPMTIEPGATATISATLSLELAGRRDASIAILFEDGSSQRVFVGATARKDRSLSSMQEFVTLRPGVEQRMLIEAQVMPAEGGLPPDPTITVPEGFTATFVEWRIIAQGDAARATANRYRGLIDVTWDGEPTGGGAVVIALDDATRVSVRLNPIRPMDVVPPDPNSSPSDPRPAEPGPVQPGFGGR